MEFSTPNYFFDLRPVGGGRPVRLQCDRLYTIGRYQQRCDIVLAGRSVSRRHCHIILDSIDSKLWLLDGSLRTRTSNISEIIWKIRSGSIKLSFLRVSRNGVYINGKRIPRGSVAKLLVGDKVSFSCDNCVRNSSTRSGFVVERTFKCEDFDRLVHTQHMLDSLPMSTSTNSFNAARCDKLINRAAKLLRHCRSILQADYQEMNVGKSLEILSDEVRNGIKEIRRSLVTEICDPGHQKLFGLRGEEKTTRNECKEQTEKSNRISYCSDGSNFFLNRLKYSGLNIPSMDNEVTLTELFHPVETLKRVFIATFTSDITWFLSYCCIPNHLPITIACHSSERCWSASLDSRTTMPYSSYPNLLLVYPRFPDVIAFGKDRTKKGVACHHPKFFVLQRDDYIRWNDVTNTVWWQDFPRIKSPDCSALFSAKDSTIDFAAELAGFMAVLITDVPSQAHWIMELSKYEFKGASAHLIASVPGIHIEKLPHLEPNHCLVAKQTMNAQHNNRKLVGCVPTSVVGLSHRFHSKCDSNGAQVKMLASFLGKLQVKTCGVAEVLLKRNENIPADANAVSVILADLDEHFEGDCMQLGFLPRDVAKWVSPLSDSGFFNFSAFIYPKEALASALGENSWKVQLLLCVSQGPKFHNISGLIQHKHYVPLCSLIASIQRRLGLRRLQEVLCRYRWPGSLEREFVYGCSSVGVSVNPQFLATFAEAVGKKSLQLSDSDESDPEWGRWSVNFELKNPSVKILFPTIERVISNAYGILHSRRMLCMSEKTWQRFRSSNVFHDAVPHPAHREGYPMHVKVARRRFQSNANSRSFGWIYSGSHNFSPAAWGQTIGNSSSERRLHICNYELGVLLIFPPPNNTIQASNNSNRKGKHYHLDDMILPFIVPPPKYQHGNRPATAQAMRDALSEAAAIMEGVDDEEGVLEEEEMVEEEVSDNYHVDDEEKEEEKIYAEMLWSQVDS